MSLPFRVLAGASLLVLTSIVSAGELTVSNAWIRGAPDDLPAGGYATISNDTSKQRVLVGASAEGFDHVMLHKSVHENGQSRMVHVERVPIAAGEQFAFSPGTFHFMLMPPHEHFEAGDQVPVTLTFADGSNLTATFIVRDSRAMSME